MSLSRNASRRVGLLVVTLALAGLPLPSATTTTASAQATVVQTNTRVPIDFFSANSCTGEEVIISGEQHIVFHSTTSANGDSTARLHINFHLQGTTPGGTTYNANETVNGIEISHVNGQRTFQNVAQLNLVSQGSTDNLRGRTEIRTIVNSNGEVTSTTFEFTVECSG